MKEKMLNRIAVSLGYRDVKHLEMNIDSYGSPLHKWWRAISKISLELCDEAYESGFEEGRKEILNDLSTRM